MNEHDPPLPNRIESSEGLRAGDAAAVGLQVADLKVSGLPLASGLRAIAADAPTRRLSRALNRLAIRLEQGSSLEGALAEANGSLPPAIKSILANDARGARGGLVLIDYLTYRERLNRLGRMAGIAAIYPALIVIGVLATTAFLITFVGASIAELATGFDIELPLYSRVFVALGKQMPLLATTLIGLLALTAVAYRFGLSVVERARMRKRVPLFGPLWRYLSVAQWCKLMALEIGAGVTLPETLRDAGQGIDDPDLGQASANLASAVELGIPFSDAAAAEPAFPESVPPMLAWAEEAGQLPETLQAMADLFEARARRQAGLVEVVLPSIAFLVVGWGIATLASALLSPLTMLIGMLS